MAKKLFRLTVLWLLLGQAYYLIEFIYRIPSGELPHPAMIAVGGLCGVAVGSINQIPGFYNSPVLVQSAIGAVITLIIEFVSGCILNLWLGLDIWDYSQIWGNLLGQVCLLFAVAWFFIMPLAIWLEDTLRWGFGWEGKRYSLGSIYLDLITGK